MPPAFELGLNLGTNRQVCTSFAAGEPMAMCGEVRSVSTGILFRPSRGDSQDSNASAGSDEGDGITIIRARGKSHEKTTGVRIVVRVVGPAGNQWV